MSPRAIAAAAVPLAFALASAAAWAQAPAGVWIADGRTGCRVWDAVPEPGETIRWSGACRNGYAEGTGVVEWYKAGSLTSTVEGTLRAGHLEGRALTQMVNGDRIEAEFRADVMEGLAVMTKPDGTKATMHFHENKPLGRVTLLRADGSKMEGEVDGSGQMRGIETSPNGNRYEGEYRNFFPNGKGTFVDGRNGGTYKGDFVDGRWEGQGEMIFDNRDIYQGAFQGGKANGYGVFRKGADGRVFRGIWVDNCLLPANSENGLGATIGKTLAECGIR